jgi:DHA2 family methylenomycin A resistance protein-like MFS transporter
MGRPTFRSTSNCPRHLKRHFIDVNSIMRSNPNSQTNRASTPAQSRRQATVVWVIAATSFAFIVVQLDVTIVNVALPKIGADFKATIAALQWVVDSYTLGFAALLLSAGSVGDRFGSKRAFVAGFIGFALASLACGFAQSITFLNVARAIQGIGAALLVPSSLALLNEACAHDKKLLARGIAFWTAAGGVSIAAGPVAGGFLLSAFGWRSVFSVNIPICALGLLLTLQCVPPSQPKTGRSTFDFPGQFLAIATLTGLIGAVIEIRPLGIFHPLVVGGAVLSTVAAAGFIAVESRSAAPMLPLALFRNHVFSGSILFGVIVNLTYYGVIFVLSLYLQKALSYGTVQAGLAFIPLTAMFIASNIASGWIISHAGTRIPMIAGACIGALGFWLLHNLDAHSNFIEMVPAFVLIPAGMGLAVPAMTTALLSNVDRAFSGTASAVLNAARQTGGAIGVAAFGALTAAGAPDQIISGLGTSALICAALLCIAAMLAFWWCRSGSA